MSLRTAYSQSPIRQVLAAVTVALAALHLGGCTSLSTGASSTPSAIKDTGSALTDARGMTLYTFDRDTTAGKSVCNDNCAIKWPPLMAEDSAHASGDYTIIARDDGRKQWAYRGKPLYLWSMDKAPGDLTGDGFMNVWHIAKR